MAKYVYRCTDCKRGEELEARMSDGPPPNYMCGDNCSGIMRRLFFPLSTIFKGSGFYSTGK